MNINQINALILAYLGDAIYELYIRERLIQKGINKVNDMQKEAIKYVSGKSQAAFIKKLIDENKLTADELDIVKRARNAKVSSHPKNIDILTYKYATAFEALIGYLYISNGNKRISELMEGIIGA